MSTNKSVKKGHKLSYPAGVMARYSSRLQALIKRMNEEMKTGLNKIAKSNKPVMDYKKETRSVDSQVALLSSYINSKWTRIFEQKAPIYAKDMLVQTNKASKASVNSSVKKLKEGFEIPKIQTKNFVINSNFLADDLREISSDVIMKNIDLIKKIPGEYVNQFQVPEVKEEMFNAIAKGDLDELNRIITKNSKRSERRAQLMAEDQIRKAFNGINAERLKKNGVQKYEWLHSGGSQFPRELHIEYDGQIFSFDDPPIIEEKTGEVGIPGDAINCLCTMNPIIEL
jgi:SPP1 gp7 family putative phage head morphogenesis protein